MTRKTHALLALLTLTLWAGQAQAVSDDDVRAIHELITDWQTPEARTRIQALLASDGDSWGVRFLEARLLFFEGRYGESAKLLAQLEEEAGGLSPELSQFKTLVDATHGTLKEFDEFASPDGRFVIRYMGRDRLMLPYVLEVLQKADAALSADFAWKPQGRVLVEIYPRIDYLAKVSPLTEEDLETSGTIALCKYNRLMFTSPRGLVKGYGWQDTVAHEFVHYYVTRISRNTVPIWLHEGIAKFQESRWRAEPNQPLDPPQEDLLARSLKADKLVTFDQMHPSMAKLPSQEAASLAFAEVHMVIDHLHRKSGYPALRTLLKGLKAGKNMDMALKGAYGVNLEGLWTRWKKEMKGRGFRTYPGLVQTSLKFKRPGESTDEDELDFSTISEKKIKDFTHLGELLRARERHKAALKEYRKAIALAGDGNPVIQNSAADSLIEVGGFAEVPEMLERVRSYYPTYLNTFIHLGEAYLKLKQTEAAITAFEQARGINPFHPRVHEALAALYEAGGQADKARLARESLEILR